MGTARQLAELLCLAVRAHSRTTQALAAGQAAMALQSATAALQALDAQQRLQVTCRSISACALSGLHVLARCSKSKFAGLLPGAAGQHAHLEDAAARGAAAGGHRGGRALAGSPGSCTRPAALLSPRLPAGARLHVRSKGPQPPRDASLA